MEPVCDNEGFAKAITDPGLVAVLCRQSTNKPNQKNSIPRQRRGLREFAERIGWAFPSKRECFYQKIKSGTARNPELDRLMDDLRAGRRRGVLLDDLSRASRWVLVSYQLWDLIKSTGALLALRSFERVLDPASDSDDILISFEAMLSESYWEILGRLSGDGSRRRAEKGLWCGGRVPMGLTRRQKGVLAPDPKAAPVAEAQLATASFLSLRQTSRLMRERFGVVVSPSTLHHRTHNPIYAGRLVYGRTRRQLARDPNAVLGDPLRRRSKRAPETDVIVVPDVVKSPVRKEMSVGLHGALGARKNNRNGFGVRWTQKTPFTLAGLAYCGRCGGRVRRRMGPRKRLKNGAERRYGYAGCWAKGCSNFSWPEVAAEQAVLKAVGNLMLEAPASRATIRTAMESARREAALRARSLERRMREVDDSCSRMESGNARQIAEGIDSYTKLLDSYRAELRELDMELDAAQTLKTLQVDDSAEARLRDACADIVGRWEQFKAHERIFVLRSGFERIVIRDLSDIELHPRLQGLATLSPSATAKSARPDVAPKDPNTGVSVKRMVLLELHHWCPGKIRAQGIVEAPYCATGAAFSQAAAINRSG